MKFNSEYEKVKKHMAAKVRMPATPSLAQVFVINPKPDDDDACFKNIRNLISAKLRHYHIFMQWFTLQRKARVNTTA